jgi:hypothetical protein
MTSAALTVETSSAIAATPGSRRYRYRDRLTTAAAVMVPWRSMSAPTPESASMAA